MAYYTQLGRCINPHDGRAIQLFDPAGSDSELPAFFSETVFGCGGLQPSELFSAAAFLGWS